MKLGKILSILWAFLIKQYYYSTHASWIGDGYSQLISNAHSWNNNIVNCVRVLLFSFQLCTKTYSIF